MLAFSIAAVVYERLVSYQGDLIRAQRGYVEEPKERTWNLTYLYKTSIFLLTAYYLK